MPLLVSTEDIRPFLPVDVAFTFVLIEDHLQLAAEEKIIPILSLEVYEKLDAGEYNQDHEQLVLYTKRALANFGYLSYSAWASVRVDDGGVSEKEDSARIDTLDGIRISCLEKGYRAIENILAYLESHADDFPEWKASSGYTVFTEFPIRTATEFQKFVDIKGSRQNFLALASAMRRAASLKLQAALGMALYEKLCNVSTAELKRLNQSYVQPALAHFAMYYGLDEQAITLDERGLLQFNNTSSGKMRTFLAAQQQAVSNLKAQMLEMGNTYMTLMLAYLASHASDYPDYQVPGVAGGAVDNDRNQSAIGFY